MPGRKVNGLIPNLVNGVSQQAPQLRMETQLAAQENYYSTIVEGLKDRPPTEHIAKLSTALGTDIYPHVINRDGTEQYSVIIEKNGQIRVFGFDGVERTVNAPNGWGYLSCGYGTAKENFRALTIADYTFITNRTASAGVLSTTSAAQLPQCLVNVLAGNYGKTYLIRVNGAVMAQYNTPTGTGSEKYVDTANVANALITGVLTDGSPVTGTSGSVGPLLQNTLTAPEWSVTRYGNAIYIVNNNGNDFTVECDDGYNGHAMVAVKDRTDKFSNLPGFGPDGYTVKIVGVNSTAADDYWVKIEKDTSGTVIWRETVAPGTVLSLNPATMPHTLVREADGTFTFKEAAWDQRTCGDATTNPNPSFVTRKINDMFFYQNRFGLLADENVVMSRSGSFFNFFRTTMTAVLDDDPIDVGASHTRVSILKNAAYFQGDLLLFSDQTQFKLQGNQLLTPKTVSMKPVTEYVNADVQPVSLGPMVYFASERSGTWTSLWEYKTDQVVGTSKADEITSHAPTYIPAGIFKMSGTTNENVIVSLTAGDPGGMYIYKSFMGDNGQKVQSAHFRWSFFNVTEVIDAEFVNSDLYVVLRRNDGVYLEKMRLHPFMTDAGIDYRIALDRRVTSTDLAAPTYDATANTTTYTLPYAPLHMTGDPLYALPVQAVNLQGQSTAQLPISGQGGSGVALVGDTRALTVVFGVPFVRSFTFSPVYSRQQNPRTPYSQTVVVQEGRLQLLKWTLGYTDTSNFTFTVTPPGRAAKPTVFTGRTLSTVEGANFGQVPVLTGKITFPIYSRADLVDITVSNDTWLPSAFTSVEWLGIQSTNDKR